MKHITPSGSVLRWAVLNLKNGFSVTGKPSAAVSPANDNEEIGRQVVIDNARNELWAYLGFRLKEQMYALELEGAARVALQDQANYDRT